MLDRSGNYLQIFTEDLVIDYSLPKFNEGAEEYKNDLIKTLAEGGWRSEEEISRLLEEDPDALLNNFSATPDKFGEVYSRLQEIASKYKAKKKKAEESKYILSADRFNNINSQNLLVLSENIGFNNRIRKDPVNRFINNLSFGASNLEAEYKKKSPWYIRIKRIVEDYIKKKKEEKKNISLIDPLDFFRLVKLTTENSKSLYVDRVEPYLAAIQKAKEMGQQALIDQLLGIMFIAKYESILRAEGFGKCITENQVVEFVKKSKKGLKLSYIKNFVRPIPNEVIELKKKADELYVFDNYCVLYYDPEGKAYSQTAKEHEEERKRKSDPILFGLLEGSRKLYYIADWVDEFCDLTLDEFIRILGYKDLDIPKEIKI